MATTTQDEAFREIQLSGKHLVFLFMAGTVMAVVIFLSGVMVGRGVRAVRGGESLGTDAANLAPNGLDANVAAAPPPPASSATTGQPVTAGEDLSYAERLNAPGPAAEQLQKAEPPEPADEEIRSTPADVAAKAEPAVKAPPAPKTAEPAQAAAASSSSEPAGTGFAIQVAALRERAEAERIVKRLAGKGYSAYVLAPAKGTPTVYRVRVGKFKERREADTVAARLQKEEQFKPWIVR